MAEPARKLPEEDQPENRPNLKSIYGGGEKTPGRGNLSAVPQSEAENEPEASSHVPESDRAVTKPDLQALEGGKEGDGQPADNLHAVKDSEVKSGKKKSATSKELQGAESAGVAGALGATKADTSTESDVVGKGYTHSTSTGRFSKFTNKVAGTRNKKLLLGGGVGGAGVIGLLLFALFALIPLKIENMVNNLQKHFFSSSENAVENQSNSMFAGYIEKYVGPSIAKNSCGSHTTKDCTTNIIGNGNNPVTNMYRTWSQARLENTLAAKYNIEIDYNNATRQYFLKAPGISDPNGQKIGENGVINDTEFQTAENVDRGTVRQTLKDALQNESKLTQVLYRYKIGRLLEEKYGIKRCIIFCGTRDALANFTNEKKNAAQIYLVQRVITPRDTALGIVLECLLNPTCSPEKTSPSTEDPNNPNGEFVGEPENPDTDTQVRTSLEDLAKSYGVEDDTAIQKMIDDYHSAEERGVSSTILAAIFDKVGLGEFTDQIANSADAIGWINQAFQLIGVISKAGPSLKKLTYITNASGAVSIYMMYRTYADEIHTGDNPGKVDATEVGSMVDSLGPGNHNSTCDTSQNNGACINPDPEVGGTATAEQTPLYSALIDGNPASVPTADSNSSLLSLLSPKVYAQSPTSAAATSAEPQYLCNGTPPKPVPSGSLVCPEEVLGLGAKNSTGADTFLQDLSNTFNSSPILSTITQIANIWNSNPITKAINGILGDIFSVLGSIPGVSNLLSFIGKVFQPFVSFIEQQLVPNPFGANMSGGRTFDEMAAGADVAGNDYAHNGLGGQMLTPQQVATINNEQQNQAKQQFRQEPFFARIFSTSSPYSLISKLAMDVPIGSANNLMKSSFASIFSDPFGKLIGGFSSIFAHQTSAATLASDPFEVTQYGYPANAIPADPENYWTQHNCGDTSNNGPNYQWDLAASDTSGDPNAANVDPNTGMPINTTTDPCMLIQATVGAAGGYFSTSNLTADDLAEAGATP